MGDASILDRHAPPESPEVHPLAHEIFGPSALARNDQTTKVLRSSPDRRRSAGLALSDLASDEAGLLQVFQRRAEPGGRDVALKHLLEDRPLVQRSAVLQHLQERQDAIPTGRWGDLPARFAVG